MSFIFNKEIIATIKDTRHVSHLLIVSLYSVGVKVIAARGRGVMARTESIGGLSNITPTIVTPTAAAITVPYLGHGDGPACA